MDSGMLTNRRLAIGVVAVQIVLLAVLVLYPDDVVAIAAVSSFIVAAAVWRFGFLIKPIIAGNARITEDFGRYEIPETQDVIVKADGERYYASVYLLVRFSQSTLEKTPEQLALSRQSYERALSSLNYVYKISNMLCPIDLTPHIDRIREKRSTAEARLSELVSLPVNANQGAQVARLKREIESYETQLEKIRSGERPMRVLNYAMTCASGNSPDDAIAKARRQAAELKTVIASTLDTELSELAGDDLKRCFEWEHMLPERENSDEFRY
jgi:hypothetical protein